MPGLLWSFGSYLALACHFFGHSYKRLGKSFCHFWIVKRLLLFAAHKGVVVRLRGGLRVPFKFVGDGGRLLNLRFLGLSSGVKSEIGIQVLIFLMLTTHLNERCLLLRLILDLSGFFAFGVVNLSSSSQYTFDWILWGRLLLFLNFWNERFWGDSLSWRRLWSVDRVFTVRNVSLRGNFCEFSIAKRTGYSVVGRWRNLGSEFLYLLLRSAVLHDIIHLASHLDCLLEWVWLFTPLGLLLVTYLSGMLVGWNLVPARFHRALCLVVKNFACW